MKTTSNHPKPKKIFYLFTKAGGAHVAAAEAIESAIKELKGDEAFVHKGIDIWSMGGKFQNYLWGRKPYGYSLKYFPYINAILFRLFSIKFLADIAIKLNYPNVGRSLRNLILEGSPDLIVSVHPLANPLVVRALKDLKLSGKIPIVNVVIELINIHRFWVVPEFDLTIVGTEEAKRKCIEYGCSPKKIKLIGMPVDPRFLKTYPDKRSLKSNMGLSPDKFTILIMGGAEGAGKIFDQVVALNQLQNDFQVIAVAGRNVELYKRLEKERGHLKFPLKIYGFTHEVPELMHASDLVLSKSGSLTIAEAIASELPLIITSSVPGQEEGNPEWIERNGMGRYCPDPKKIVKIVTEFIGKNEIEKMKKNIRKIKNPRETFEIAEDIINFARL